MAREPGNRMPRRSLPGGRASTGISTHLFSRKSCPTRLGYRIDPAMGPVAAIHSIGSNRQFGKSHAGIILPVRSVNFVNFQRMRAAGRFRRLVEPRVAVGWPASQVPPIPIPGESPIMYVRHALIALSLAVSPAALAAL